MIRVEHAELVPGNVATIGVPRTHRIAAWGVVAPGRRVRGEAIARAQTAACAGLVGRAGADVVPRRLAAKRIVGADHFAALFIVAGGIGMRTVAGSGARPATGGA